LLLKRLRFRNVAILIGLGLLIALCALFFWLFYWDDLRADWSLRLYPGLRQVGDSYGYYGASSGLKINYYWTSDSIEQVQNYYQKFTYPFVKDLTSGGWITVFSLDSSELTYHTIDGKTLALDFPSDPFCHYTQRYECANVRIVPIKTTLGALPGFLSGPTWINVKPPLSITELSAGTLVIYSYFINDF
jgi:hypothetical protein